MSYGDRVRKDKEKRPERYCRHPRCLWRTVDGAGNPTPCRSTKHTHYADASVVQQVKQPESGGESEHDDRTAPAGRLNGVPGLEPGGQHGPS